MIAYKHFSIIFQMLISNSWWIIGVKDGGTGRGKGRSWKWNKASNSQVSYLQHWLALSDGWVSETSKPEEWIMLA